MFTKTTDDKLCYKVKTDQGVLITSKKTHNYSYSVLKNISKFVSNIVT